MTIIYITIIVTAIMATIALVLIHTPLIKIIVTCLLIYNYKYLVDNIVWKGLVMRKLIWWVFAGTSGGPNRARIVMALKNRPFNAHQLAETLNLNYKTVRHHLKLLEENNIITSSGKNKYGELYFLTTGMEENYDIFEDLWNELKE